MIILVDLDGVTADLESLFWRLWKARFPEAPQLLPEDRRTFYIEEQIGSEWKKQVETIIHSELFYLNLPVIPGAIDGIHGLQEQGHNVILCTSPVNSPYCTPEKIMWVRKHLGTDMATRMIISKDKTLVRGDILFDDRPNVTGALQPTWLQILCEQPYNSHINQPRATWASLSRTINGGR